MYSFVSGNVTTSIRMLALPLFTLHSLLNFSVYSGFTKAQSPLRTVRISSTPRRLDPHLSPGAAVLPLLEPKPSKQAHRPFASSQMPKAEHSRSALVPAMHLKN